MNPAGIIRDPEAAARESYDLIIVGGGIYGAMLALESSLGGLRSLLLEREDFGGATSFNSLRIIHGGLRYLQGLDLPRFFESVAERRWLLKTFPEQVRPLPCLMPLYGQGLKRPAILRLALAINDRLSRSGNEGLAENSRLPGSRVIGPTEVKGIFPAVDPRDLRGGAVWYDAAMEDSQRVLMGVLRWACASGARVLNYVEARELLRTASGVAGVRAWDQESGQGYEFRSGVVINAAGPWCREVAARFDRDPTGLFHPSLAWNVVFDRAALSPMALGLAPKSGKAPMYFLRPWKGKLLAGMGHHPGSEMRRDPRPSPAQMLEVIGHLNQAVPGLDLSPDEVLRVFAGWLPVSREGSLELTTRGVFIDHQKIGGPPGLYSISGVKFTTARRAAAKILDRIFSRQKERFDKQIIGEPVGSAESGRGVFPYDWFPPPGDREWQKDLKTIIEEESVVHLEDLIFRRTSLGDNLRRAGQAAEEIGSLFPWDKDRRQQEQAALRERIRVLIEETTHGE